jgi:ankyrin repeat protein
MDFFKLIITGTSQSVKAAINKGAKVNARDENGWTPPMCAAAFNQNPEVITTLLKAGANINAQNELAPCMTALIWAAVNNQNPEVIMRLLKAGADAKVKNSAGKTAFDCAHRLKGTDVYKKLEDASK